MIAQHSIQEVFEQARVEEVISDYLDLEKSGSGYKACCPFHDEKTPSFHVSPSRNIYKCFGCGASGGPVKFLQEHQNLSFPEAVRHLGDKYKIRIEHSGEREDPKVIEERAEQQNVLKAAHRLYQNILLDQPIDEPVAAYLLHWRKFDIETIAEWGVGWAPDEWRTLTERVMETGTWEPAQKLGLVKHKNGKNYDTFRARAIIPIHDHYGNLVGLAGRIIEEDSKAPKYINSSESDLYHKGRILFGLHLAQKAIRERQFAYLTEGYTDVISFREEGLENTVATCGTALTPDQAKLMARYTKHVVICYDGDTSGQEAAVRAIDILLKEGLKVEVAILPEGEDPDSYIRGNSEDDMELQDGVTWKAEQLMTEASDPDRLQDGAMQIARMLSVIMEPFKRNAYINDISNTHKKYLKKGDLTKSVKDMTARYVDRDRKTEVVDLLPPSVDEEEKDNYEKYQFYQDKGRYFSFGTGGQLYEVSNFTMKILYHVETGDESAYRLIEVRNVFNFTRTIQVSTDDFVSVTGFKKILERKGNFLFKGSDVDLYRLKEKLFREERITKRVDVLGYNQKYNVYVFSNGVIDCNKDFDDPENVFIPADQFGIVELEEVNLFIPGNSVINEDKDEYVNDRKFKFVKSDVTFEAWCEQYVKVYGNKGVIALPFYVSGLFRDIIKAGLDNRFPLLNLYGIYESGKTSFMESLLFLFGEPPQPLELGGASTPVGYARTLAQYCNAIVPLDEYSNSLKKNYIDFLKGIYQGTGYTRGQKNNSIRTDQIINKSAAMLAGQEMPTWDAALFTRVIMLTFSQKTFTEEQKREFDKLQAMQSRGLSHITGMLQKYRKQFKLEYNKIYKETFREMRRTVNDNAVSDRMIKNNACLGATAKLLSKYVTLPFTYEQFLEIAVVNLKKQFKVMAGSDDVQKFWKVVEDLFKSGQIKEGTHFMLREGELWISIQNVYGLYEKEMRMRGSSNVIDESTLRSYLKIDPSIYLGESRKMFSDGMYPRIMRFVYNKLDLDLIREQDAAKRAERMEKMGVKLEEEDEQDMEDQHVKEDDDLPF